MIFEREQFGRNMYFYLRKRQLSQQELADKSGVGRVAINRWIRGAALPSIECLILVAKALDVTLDELMKDVVKE